MVCSHSLPPPAILLSYLSRPASFILLFRHTDLQNRETCGANADVDLGDATVDWVTREQFEEWERQLNKRKAEGVKAAFWMGKLFRRYSSDGQGGTTKRTHAPQAAYQPCVASAGASCVAPIRALQTPLQSPSPPLLVAAAVVFTKLKDEVEKVTARRTATERRNAELERKNEEVMRHTREVEETAQRQMAEHRAKSEADYKKFLGACRTQCHHHCARALHMLSHVRQAC